MDRRLATCTMLAVLIATASTLQACKVTGAAHVPVPAETLNHLTAEIELPYDRSLDAAGNFTGVSTAGDLACAVEGHGGLNCHGSPDEVVGAPPSGTFVAVDVSRATACATPEDGHVTCWGEPLEHAPPDVALSGVDLGPLLGCGVREDGAVQCWGDAAFAFYPLEGAFTKVAVGTDHLCALLDEGRAVCLGPHATAEFAAPDQPLAEISVGDLAACGIDEEDATLVCWGFIDADPPRAEEPITLVFEGDLAEVDDPASHIAGLLEAAATDDDTIRTTEQRRTIAGNIHLGAPPAGAFAEISVGPYDACASTPDGAPVCWGRCLHDLCEVTPPTATHISVGLSNACGIEPTGNVVCWGRSLRNAAAPVEDGTIWLHFR